uniref:Fatty acyl-CoA reductase n=1 Tax=Oryza meridionalis TaxID=40149 RepID=A0A0E0DVR8_9ORYZ
MFRFATSGNFTSHLAGENAGVISRARSGRILGNASSGEGSAVSAFPSDKVCEVVEKMKLMQCKQGASSTSSDHTKGIGIVQLLRGKNFLITGATGFLVKVLLDPILRTNPDVGKIYVLIKAKDNEAAMKRLKNEVEDTELFRCLQEIHGKNYHSFVSSKQVPVVGNVREANIGIAPELAKEIAEEVDVIVNSAANTTFDERYDVALDINTVGPFRIMSFAQRFRRLKLFLQVSTALSSTSSYWLIQEEGLKVVFEIASVR